MERIDNIVEAVCRLPMDFRSGSISAIELVRRSGYLTERAGVTVDRIAECLAKNPRWVDSWFDWSADNRSSPAWWLASKRPGVYQVGYYDPALRHQVEPLAFNGKVPACAEFVTRYLEKTASQADGGGDINS